MPSEDEQRPIIALVDEILEAKTADPCADTAKEDCAFIIATHEIDLPVGNPDA